MVQLSTFYPLSVITIRELTMYVICNSINTLYWSYILYAHMGKQTIDVQNKHFELFWLAYAVNAPFNNISVISWQSVLLVEETRVPGENHRPVASH